MENFFLLILSPGTYVAFTRIDKGAGKWHGNEKADYIFATTWFTRKPTKQEARIVREVTNVSYTTPLVHPTGSYRLLDFAEEIIEYRGYKIRLLEKESTAEYVIEGERVQALQEAYIGQQNNREDAIKEAQKSIDWLIPYLAKEKSS